MGFLFHSHNSDCSATVMQYLCVIHVIGHQTFSMEKIGVGRGPRWRRESVCVAGEGGRWGGGGDVCYTISVQTPQLLKKKVAGKLNPCLPARQHLAARPQQFRLQRSSSATVLAWSRSDCGFHSYALLTASSPASDFCPFVHSIKKLKKIESSSNTCQEW